MTSVGSRSIRDGSKAAFQFFRGKFFEIDLQPGAQREEAAQEMDRIAREVHANPVMEDYRVEFIE